MLMTPNKYYLEKSQNEITFVNPLYCSHFGQNQLLRSGNFTHVFMLQNQQLTRQGKADL